MNVRCAGKPAHSRGVVRYNNDMTEQSSHRYRVQVTGDVSGQVIVRCSIVARLHQDGGPEPDQRFPNLTCVGRSIVLVDVQDSGRLTSRQQTRMRADLLRICACGLAAIQQPWEDADSMDLGDGLRFLMSPEITPPTRIIDEFGMAVEDALREHTAASGTSGRIRLRMAIHFGFLDRIDEAWSGEPLVHATRLVNAVAVKQLLRDSEHANLALVVSDDFYQKIIRQGHTRESPAGYQRIDVVEKELATNAWARLA